MSRQSPNPANSSLRAAQEARLGPRRCAAGPVPGSAFPRRGTLWWPLSHRSRPQSACVGHGTRAASASTVVAFDPQLRAAHDLANPLGCLKGQGKGLQHSVIAFCATHVLNALGAPFASLTGKLTRHERGPNRGRPCTKTRCGGPAHCIGRRRPQTTLAARIWPIRIIGRQRQIVFTSGCRCSHRAELCGTTPARRAPLP